MGCGRVGFDGTGAECSAAACTDAAPDAGQGAADSGGPDVGRQPDASLDDTGVDVGQCTAEGNFCVAEGVATCEAHKTRLLTPCPFGCAGDPPACQPFVPSNVETLHAFGLGVGDLVVGGSAATPYWLIDTETGRITAHTSAALSPVGQIEKRAPGMGVVTGVGFETLAQADAEVGTPRLGLFFVRRLVVTSGFHLVARGSLPLAVMADADINIAGAVDVGGHFGGSVEPGPGGGRASEGPGQGVDAGGGDSAAGGGSYGGVGGKPGPDGADPGAAGPTYGSAKLTPLVGGSGGGSAARPGGAGGGAMQLIAQTEIRISGQVNAGGGGAQRSTSNAAGGGGGGSGGALLLEAPEVVLEPTSALGANGGAGGLASAGATLGARGSALFAPAPGELGGFPGGNAGNGSDPLGVASDGTRRSGGGGGCGRIRINTTAGDQDYSSQVLPRVAPYFTQGQLSGE